jgi:hypothetical protein
VWLDFSLQLLSGTFLIMRRETIVSVHISSYRAPDILVRFHETLILSTDFQKSSNIKFRENPCSWSRVSCGRTYRQIWRSEQSLLAILPKHLTVTRLYQITHNKCRTKCWTSLPKAFVHVNKVRRCLNLIGSYMWVTFFWSKKNHYRVLWNVFTFS